ncbi:DUF1641 domain-containing protein [Halobellus limi]|uniref:DUF1641 domain-containing protein n=1 Tax=Halobellus limi TaxID=699433 RepID=A0A1H6C2G2_9EURY|nr:DUF1641 domain-containing protein [Halobellus limi]QCC48560.1 DUF1641 domain-containing protein [Halobellus limi]SEG67149.1 Uncharacterized conserved protein YjgD, DUF1641 family [Halobellus limi]
MSEDGHAADGDAPADGDAEAAALEGADLETAIAENPEAVAAFVRRLDAVNELLDVLALGESALDDEMVRSLAGTGSTLVESADGLATEETVELAATVGDNGEELQGALESLLVLQRTGTLDELVEVADVLSLLTSALDDEMVRSLAGTGSALGEVAQTAGDDDVRDGLETLLSGVGEAAGEEPERVGAVGLLKRSRDPDVQYGLGFLLALAGSIGRASADDGS